MAKKLGSDTAQTVLEAFALVIEEARAEFEAERTEQAAAWKKELARLKEEDQYQFNKEKRDREDTFAAELKSRLKKVEDREEAVDGRAMTVDHAESTLAELEAKVADFQKQLAAAESTGYYKALNQAEKDHAADLRIKEAEWNADKRVFEAKIANMNGMIENYESTIQSLHQELAAANARVETIATNAVQASGQSKVTVNAANTK